MKWRLGIPGNWTQVDGSLTDNVILAQTPYSQEEDSEARQKVTLSKVAQLEPELSLVPISPASGR